MNENSSDSHLIRRQANRIKELNNELMLMAAGRDQDNVEAKERAENYEKRLKQAFDAHAATMVFDFNKTQELQKELDKQKAGMLVEANRRADAEAKIRDLECQSQNAGVARAIAVAHDDGVRSIRPALQEANKRIDDLTNRLKTAGDEICGLKNQNATLERKIICDLMKPLRPAGIMAVVDGQVFEVDDLCKAHSNLKKEFAERGELNYTAQLDLADLRDEVFRLKQELDHNKARRTALEIQTEEIPVREIRCCVDGKFYTTDDLCKAHSELTADVTRCWKRGFDAGRDQTMKFVSDFCKEQTERLHGPNPNLSGLS